MLDRVTRFLVDHRLPTLAAILVVTAGMGVAASDLTFTTSPESILESGYEELDGLRSHEAVFGTFERRAILVLTTTDAFSEDFLSRIRAAGESIAAIDGIEDVRSIAASDFPLPDRRTDPAAFRTAVLGNRLLCPNLVSEDARTAAIHVDLSVAASAPDRRAETLARVEAAARAAGLDPLVAGVPAIRRAYAQNIRRDLIVLTPVVGALLAILLLCAFRRLTAVLTVLGSVGLAAVWTLGILSLTGGRITALTAILPPLVLVVGMATGVHVVSQFREQLRGGAAPRDAARRAMAHMAAPCGLTALTTAVGFSSLVVARIRDVQEFGLYAGVGALAAFLLGLPLVGIFLSFGSPRVGPEAGIHFERPLRGLALMHLRHPRAGLFAGSALMLLAVAGLLRVESNTYMLEDLEENAPTARATRVADEHLGGIIGFDLVLDREDGLLGREELAFLRGLEERLRRLPGVKAVIGPATLVDEAAEAVGLDPASVPGSLVLQGLRLRGGADVAKAFVAPGGRLGRIFVRTGDVGSERSEGIREEALRLAREGAPDGLGARVGGLTVLAEELLGRLVGEMAKSTAIAFVVIFLLMSLLFRSLRVGVLSMVPNFLPLLAAGGFMGFAGITVRSSIALIFAVALGIAVDDTIHILTRYLRERRAGASVRRAVSRSIRWTGRPVLLTSIILCAGFLAFLLSGFKATEQFGLIAAVTIATALVGDILLLPSLLLLGRRRSS